MDTWIEYIGFFITLLPQQRAGNLATEDIVFLAHKMGYETGIDRDKLWILINHLEKVMGRKLGGRTSRT